MNNINADRLAVRQRARLALLIACLVLTISNAASAALTITRGDLLTTSRPANLILNGSFEIGNPGTNFGWTPSGSHLGGYPGTEVPIPLWIPSWPDGAYGWWGPLGFASDTIPDGNNAVYFGNSFNSVGVPASVAANGVVTFTGSPTLTGRPAPVTLSQTVTGLSTTTPYRLDFWTAGESGFTATGIFGLNITGEGLTYLVLPSPANALGASERYYVDFTPSAATITFEFLNWGHINDIDGFGTELVLDDVILNVIPEPASITLMAVGALGLIGWLHRRSKAA